MISTITKLERLAQKYGTDKRAAGHSYIQMYDSLLKTVKVNSLLEVGFGCGSSIKMWLEYFKGKKIYCIEDFGWEYDKFWKDAADTNIKGMNLIRGDSKLKETWDSAPYELDVIIDDGDHHPKSQIDTFLVGFSHLRKGGLYFIEDTHVNFYTPLVGDDIIYKWIFEHVMSQQEAERVFMNGNFYDNAEAMDEIAKQIYSYHFYRSVIVLEKA
jgi:hypothetical protein